MYIYLFLSNCYSCNKSIKILYKTCGLEPCIVLMADLIALIGRQHNPRLVNDLEARDLFGRIVS